MALSVRDPKVDALADAMGPSEPEAIGDPPSPGF